MEYILGFIYLKFFTDDFDIKVPKPSRSVKNMTLYYMNKLEVTRFKRIERKRVK